ncbi:MAG TPA: carbohydrate kinase family protein [Caldithrix abyssi]|uniref:Carbohydrate kinase family protein n=1 Tax=Caldithrix abyssi TaxID=187145 RepID=A0A7V5LJM7_CALAY|nr:carbohydrate kinase family protein [Caldithrix abyssi]
MAQKKYDALVVGELNVDLILNKIDGFPEIGKEKLAEEMTLTLGSSSAIFASNLSALGAKVAFVGKIGHDQFGELVLQSLENKGVSTEFIIQDKTLNTGATIVLNYDEDRAMLTHPGAMNHLTIKDITPEILKTARHLHFSSYYLQPGIREDVDQLFKMAKENGLTTSFDMQWDPEEKWQLPVQKILPFVDVFLPNRQELIYLTGQINLKEAIKKLRDNANTVVVKMGNEGSFLFDTKAKLEKTLPAYKNEQVVDAIGAGDSFNAGFIFKFIQGAPLEECQRFGNLCGAINTTAAGGTSAFQNYEQIMKIARERFGYED